MLALRSGVVVGRVFLLVPFATLAALGQTGPVGFNRDIRPIMSDTCFKCHGPDKNARVANLRLDLRDMALKPLPDGKIPIVPGDPEKSAIVQRIFAKSAGLRMPPVQAHKDLSLQQKETIRRWVAEGAHYEGHWAYQQVRSPTVPDVPGDDASLVNPIDHFIQERLVREQLRPSPEADRRTLIRRVTLDLTGLLPAPDDVVAFENDRSSDAYEKLVDRLLASDAYSEQQTMHWLDAVRYADTCGFHGDNLFPAWPYRDYVLRSFRANKAFDQFTREQIAGDLLPDATLDQKVASAYNRLNRTSAEGGIQPKEYLAKYGADRVRTLSSVWLGSTMGCAECHDHKFDPFLTKDFYSMKAFFADVDETGLVPDQGEKAWGAQLELPTPEQSARRLSLDAQIAAAAAALNAQLKRVPRGRAREKTLFKSWQQGLLAWHFQTPESTASDNGTILSVEHGEGLHDGLMIASGPNPDNESFTITLHPGTGQWTAVGVSVQQNDDLPGDEVARGADRFLLTSVSAVLREGPQQEHQLTFSLATGNQKFDDGMPAMAVLDQDPNTGWGTMSGEPNNPFLALRFSSPLMTTAESRIVVRLSNESRDYRRAVMGHFRLALSSAQYSWPSDGDDADSKKKEVAQVWANGLSSEVVADLRVPRGKRTAKQKQAIREYLEWSAPQVTPLFAQLEDLEAQRNVLQASIARVVTTVATTPRETHILPRGNWMDDSAPLVEPAIPEMFGKVETGGRRATRLDLANWLISESNPLTARAFVNRTWRQFFGTGISKVLDDLGSQGEWPTHPELLDWLASEFVHPQWQAEGAHAWDVQHLLKIIVMSHTYRQTSQTNPRIQERDPENRLLARQTSFRVDAENVHDIALQVSGLLYPKFGGPSVRPYQPGGYLAALNFPKREYSASRGDDLYRRAVYTEWRRTFLHPSLLAFDAPTREECTVNRSTSNTPLQALVLLNDPIYVEAARVFAEHTLESGGATIDARVDWAFHRALDRSPNSEEQRRLGGLYRDSLQLFQHDQAAAHKLLNIGESVLPKNDETVELAALTMVTRTILNLHETITRN